MMMNASLAVDGPAETAPRLVNARIDVLIICH